MDLNLLHFRAEGMALLQNGGNLFTGSLSWNPMLSFESVDNSMMDLFGVRLHLGAFPIKNQTSDLSVGGDGQVLWVTRFQTTALEVGPGIQYFLNQGGSRITVNANLDIDFNLLKGVWARLRQLVIGYSALIDSTYFTNEVRVGIGIQL